jgi:hypothetical protein
MGMNIDVQAGDLIPQFSNSIGGNGCFHWEKWDLPVEKQS